MRGDEDFFSVARTMPFVAIRLLGLWLWSILKLDLGSPLMPRAVTPWLTAFKAYSEAASLA